MKKLLALVLAVFGIVTLVCAQTSISKVWQPDENTLRIEAGGKIDVRAGGAVLAAGTPAPVVIAVSTVPASATMTGAEVLAAVQTQIANANNVNTRLRAIGVLATPTP